jgi:hypothetical protein
MNTFGVGLDVAVEAKFAKIFSDNSYNHEKSGEAISYLDQNTKSSANFSLGGDPP